MHGVPLIVVAIFGGVLALMVLLLVAAAVSSARRRDALSAFATSREWTYRRGDTHLARRFDGDPFGRGSARSVHHVVEGRYEGRWFVAFDYAFTTGTRSGDRDDSTRHRFSVISMHLGEYDVPRLQVSPQGAIGRFFSNLFGTASPVGHDDFDRAFAVRTESPGFAREVLQRRLTLQLLTAQDRAWRMEGDSLLLFRQGVHSPDEIDAVLAFAASILDAVPVSTWSRFGGPGPR